jgi:multicomponent Na+:H+ antiporter subunit C
MSGFLSEFLTVSAIMNAGAFGLIAIGLLVIFTRRNIIMMIVGLNIAEVGVNLLLVNAGYVKNGTAPIFTAAFGKAFAQGTVGPMSDPVPQALVLTAIVIGFGITALALSLAIRLHDGGSSLDIHKMRGLKW